MLRKRGFGKFCGRNNSAILQQFDYSVAHNLNNDVHIGNHLDQHIIEKLFYIVLQA